MRFVLLFAFVAVITTPPVAQIPSNTFLATFDAERGSTLALSANGSLWLGGMKDERVIIARLSPEGKILERHGLNFDGPGQMADHLTALIEDSDGMLTGCGNFEQDNTGRGFIFRYNPVLRKMIWSHLVRSNTTYMLGVTELGAGGDFVFNGSPHFNGGHAAELIQVNRLTGQPAPGKALRYSLGGFEEFIRVVYHEGALYAAGRFTGTAPYPPARMRGVICKIDTATFDLAWTRVGPIPISSSGQFYGRDLLIDDGFIVSTTSGDHQNPDLNISDIYLKKTDLDGNLIWGKQIKLPAFKGEFAEEIISLPDGYLLCGHDILEDTSRLFLLKTNKNGEPVSVYFVNFGYNDEFSEVPGRSKMVRLGNSLFLTAVNQNDVGQTQGMLLKTSLDGFINDTCDAQRIGAVTFTNFPEANQLITAFSISPSPATFEPSGVLLSIPELTLYKACGAGGTCPDLPDLQMTIDSITCLYGTARLHYSFCNMGGQVYEGTAMVGLYDKNPFTDSAKLVHILIYPGESLAPGDCTTGFADSDPFGFIPNQLDTFPKLYAMIGIHPNMPIPVKPGDLPFSPNQPECGYENNLDSIDVPAGLCGNCDSDPPTFVKTLGSPQRQELGFTMCNARDGNVYVAGSSGDNSLIAKITPLGEPIWVRNFPPTISNEPLSLSEILEDSDGMLVLCGTEGLSPSNRKALVMRYNPVSGTILWYKRFLSNRPEASGILERGPGGDFVLRNNYQQVVNGVLKTRSELWQLNRSNGGVLGILSERYLGDPHIRLESMILDQGSFYAAGSWQMPGALESSLPLLAKFSTDGIPVWTQVTTPDTAVTTRQVASYSDIIVDSDYIMVTGTETKDPAQAQPGVYLTLARHAKDGALLWMKRYDISMYPEDVIAMPDAYFIFGVIGGNRWGMVKTDKFGNLLVAKVLDITPAPLGTTFYANRQNQLILTGNHLMMLDHTQGNGNNDILLVRTDLHFGIDDSCSLLQTVHPKASLLPARAAPFILPYEGNSITVNDAGTVFQTDSLEVRQLCPECVATNCADVTFRAHTVQCSSGHTPTYKTTVCNAGDQVINTPFEVTFFDKNPLLGAAQPIFGIVVNDPVDPGQCLELEWPLPGIALQYSKLYSLAGVGNNVTTPVNTAGFPFPQGFAECNYANNLDSFDLNIPAPAPPALGPDRVLCAGDSAALDAGAGYAAYQWLNGPATPIYTVSTSGNYTVAVTDACGRTLHDTVEVTVLPPVPPTTLSIPFFPGDTVLIGGTAYTQPGTVVQTLASVAGCDSVVTYILEQINTALILQCPADQTVTLPLNQTSVPVNYPLPNGTTDCPDPVIDLKRLLGPPSGGAFPQGATMVCYEAANQCGIRDTCCFTVTVLPSADLPCDVKTPPGCLRYELLDIRYDAKAQRRYRVRVTNACASSLQYVYIQLPKGVTAVSPADGSVYAATANHSYTVRNANASPFYSIRYKALAGGLNNGQSDVFEYTLPQQAAPDYIHVAARLADGTGSETHLNTFYCPVLPFAPLPIAAERETPPLSTGAAAPTLSVRPNPTSGQLRVDLHAWAGAPVYIQVFDALGQRVLERRFDTDGEGLGLDLPANLANGLYNLSVCGEDGRKAAVRFVLAR